MKVELISCGPAVNESERKAAAQLKTRLIAEQGDGEWLLLTNLAFSTTHRRQSDEIDIVAIGPPGVRVIEVKHWTAAWVKRNLTHAPATTSRLGTAHCRFIPRSTGVRRRDVVLHGCRPGGS